MLLLFVCICGVGVGAVGVCPELWIDKNGVENPLKNRYNDGLLSLYVFGDAICANGSTLDVLDVSREYGGYGDLLGNVRVNSEMKYNGNDKYGVGLWLGGGGSVVSEKNVGELLEVVGDGFEGLSIEMWVRTQSKTNKEFIAGIVSTDDVIGNRCSYSNLYIEQEDNNFRVDVRDEDYQINENCPTVSRTIFTSTFPTIYHLFFQFNEIVNPFSLITVYGKIGRAHV